MDIVKGEILCLSVFVGARKAAKAGQKRGGEIELKSRSISVYPRAFFVEIFKVRLDVHIFTSNLLH